MSTIKNFLLLIFFNICCIESGFSKELDFSDIELKAKTLASQNYQEINKNDLSKELEQLDYEQYIKIKFPQNNRVWVKENCPFDIDFFHRGYLFKSKVKINVVDANKIESLQYSPNLFECEDANLLSNIKSDIGFAGFRIGYKYPFTNEDPWKEVASFLGASYFRAVGYQQDFGLSARALAIDTGLPTPEEFPEFREFWFIKPKPLATSLTFFALLDSPSVTGAYQFILHPDKTLTFDVKSHLYFRKPVQRLGIGPITSMYFKGRTDSTIPHQEVHDSDGLLIKTALNQEYWQYWRALNNPSKWTISILKQDHSAAFGLFQRERDKNQYQDLNYQNRPNLLIEPLSDWGAGAIYLYEMPSKSDTIDNIAAFWVPNTKISAGDDYIFDYRIHFTLSTMVFPKLAYVTSTQTNTVGSTQNNNLLRHFILNFSSVPKENSEKARPLSSIEPIITSSAGEIQNIKLSGEINSGFILEFDLNPKDFREPIELRAYLKSGEAISETWLYQWQAPF